MKREADSDLESPQKRARNVGGGDCYEMRFLIPSKIAGGIIGKGGNNITRLRSENPAIISIPDCPGPERLITISSEDQEVVFGVLTQLLPMMDDATKDRSETPDGRDVELRLLCHEKHVGTVIGKGGGIIKELRETTGSRIRVYGICCPRSTDRVIAIIGRIELILNSVKRIVQLIVDNNGTWKSEPYDPHYFNEGLAAEYGGFVGGFGVSGYRDGYGGGSSSARGFRMGGGGSPRRGILGGYHDCRLTRGRSSSRGGGPYYDDGRGGNGGHRDYREPYAAEHDDDRQTSQVTIPIQYAGAIIGRGGSRIRRVRADSGAGIIIAEPEPGDPDRIITISGNAEQIRLAQYFLQQSIKDHGEPRNF